MHNGSGKKQFKLGIYTSIYSSQFGVGKLLRCEREIQTFQERE